MFGIKKADGEFVKTEIGRNEHDKRKSDPKTYLQLVWDYVAARYPLEMFLTKDEHNSLDQDPVNCGQAWLEKTAFGGFKRCFRIVTYADTIGIYDGLLRIIKNECDAVQLQSMTRNPLNNYILASNITILEPYRPAPPDTFKQIAKCLFRN